MGHLLCFPFHARAVGTDDKLWALGEQGSEGSSFTQHCNGAGARQRAQLGTMPKWELKVCSGISTPKHINILRAGKGASEWECWAGSSSCWKMHRNK